MRTSKWGEGRAEKFAIIKAKSLLKLITGIKIKDPGSENTE